MKYWLPLISLMFLSTDAPSQGHQSGSADNAGDTQQAVYDKLRKFSRNVHEIQDLDQKVKCADSVLAAYDQ